MAWESPQRRRVGSRAEVVNSGFGVVFTTGVGVSRQRGGSTGGEGGGVEGYEVAIAGVGVAFGDGAGLVGDGGGAELLVTVGVEAGGAGDLADEFVDVAALGVFSGGGGEGRSGGVIGVNAFAHGHKDHIARGGAAGGFTNSATGTHETAPSETSYRVH